jgi:hypothetical protein
MSPPTLKALLAAFAILNVTVTLKHGKYRGYQERGARRGWVTVVASFTPHLRGNGPTASTTGHGPTVEAAEADLATMLMHRLNEMRTRCQYEADVQGRAALRYLQDARDARFHADVELAAASAVSAAIAGAVAPLRARTPTLPPPEPRPAGCTCEGPGVALARPHLPTCALLTRALRPTAPDAAHHPPHAIPKAPRVPTGTRWDARLYTSR